MEQKTTYKYIEELTDKYLKRKCPKCGKLYTGYPALSRRDNKTEICSDCGTKEALEDFIMWQNKNK